MKGYWFKMRGRQLLKEMEPEAVFGFCDGWFDRFKVRPRSALDELPMWPRSLQRTRNKPFKSFIGISDRYILVHMFE